MASDRVLVEENHDTVRILRLNRPDRKNALTDELGWALIECIRQAGADDSVRVIGITGNGSAFCSGADLAQRGGPDEFSGMNEQDIHLDDLSWVGRFLLVMNAECDKPIVAGINGVAVGAGLALAMCADMRIISDTATIHPGYVRAGTSPDGGLSWTLPRLIGHEQAMRFLLDPRMVSAEEALEKGIVGEVVAADQFEARLLAYCAGLAALAPIGVRQTKRLLVRSMLSGDMAAHLREEMIYVRRGLSSRDGKEAVQAIMEKREPRFEGR